MSPTKLRLTRIILLLWLLATQLAWAEGSIDETVLELEALYDACPSDAACLFYEPSYVLAFADLRAEASWTGVVEVRNLGKVESLAKSFGHRVSFTEDGDLQVQSLKGLALTSRRSRFNWLPGEFDVSSGWEGYDEWFRLAKEQVPNELRREAFHYVKGIAYGYPDSSIAGFIGTGLEPVRMSRAILSSIPYSDYLSTGQPNFKLLPEDMDSPDVERVCREWGEFLETFYTHPKVRQKLSDAAFLAQRRRIRKGIRFGRYEFWRRGDQLGDPVHFANPMEHHLTIQDERVLRDSIDGLEKLIETGAPPYAWVGYLQEKNLTGNYAGWITPEKLQTWIWYGAYGHVEHRKRFHHAVLSQKPDFMRAVYQQRIADLFESDKSESQTTIGLAILLSHPGFPEFFDGLSPTERRRISELVTERQDQPAIRAVNLLYYVRS